MAKRPVQEIVKQVKPLLSSDVQEARGRVLQLYKAWYREIPPLIVTYRMPITVSQGRKKLKEEFLKHKDVTDVRAIDLLVIKGQMEFKETLHKWKQECHIMYYFKEDKYAPPPTFLSKFLSGED